jgi:RimK family alpha-L-glutamate ligase
MRIGILSAELDETSKAENQLLEEEINRLGHKSVLLGYGKNGRGFVYLPENRFYTQSPAGQPKIAEVDVVIPRINEPEALQLSLGTQALRALIAHGAVSITQPTAIEIAKNKARTLERFWEHGLPFPKTVLPTTLEVTNPKEIQTMVEPDPDANLVHKDIYGTLGKGTREIGYRRSGNTMLDRLEEPALIQEFIKTPGYPDYQEDIRIVIINGEYITSYKRRRKLDDDIRTNVYAGGQQIPYESSDEENELAIKGASAVDGGEGSALGMDEFEVLNAVSLADGHRLNEANASLGFGHDNYPETRRQIARSLVKSAIQKAT